MFAKGHAERRELLVQLRAHEMEAQQRRRVTGEGIKIVDHHRNPAEFWNIGHMLPSPSASPRGFDRGRAIFILPGAAAEGLDGQLSGRFSLNIQPAFQPTNRRSSPVTKLSISPGRENFSSSGRITAR